MPLNRNISPSKTETHEAILFTNEVSRLTRDSHSFSEAKLQRVTSKLIPEIKTRGSKLKDELARYEVLSLF